MSRTALVCLALVIASGSFVERAAAQIPASDGTFYACVRLDRDKDEGRLARLVAADEACRRNETRIHWSQQGPRGVPGTNGINGTNGTNGTNGRDGTDGANGQDGTSVTITGTFTGGGGGCSNGGLTLLDGATNTTYFLCDGRPGKDGKDGQDGKDGVLGSLDQLAGLPCTLPSGRQGSVALNISAGGAISLQCAVADKRIFVTSTSYQGNLGGAAGADLACQGRAIAAGLGGTWKAWLSTSVSSPATSFTHTAAPYVRVDGTVIAADWTALTSGSLMTGVVLDEFGTYAGPSEVWTSTSTAGTYTGGGCTDFTSNSSAAPYAYQGISDRNSSAWTTVYLNFCDRWARLYCVEQ